ncbi:MAG: glycosyltransferase [Coriobacteriia bacterium]
MKIAMISDHASPLAVLGGVDSGGQNIYVAEMAREMARLGHEVDVFTRRDDPSLASVVEISHGLRVIHVEAGPHEHVAKERMLPLMPQFAEEVCGYIAVGGHDVVHANFFMSGIVACEVKRRLGVPFAITFHALGEVRRKYQGADDGFPDERCDLERQICREADLIIAECPQDRHDLLTFYGAKPESVRIIPCGIDPKRFAPIERAVARELIGIPAGAPMLLQLGRMVRRKGIENAVRALPLLQDGRGRDAVLMIVGGESPDADPRKTPEIGRLQRVAEELGVSDRVIFTGCRSQAALPYYYSAADVFITTPWYEPFGITPLEAMACGVPVVGSRVGGIKYSVLDGKTGYLVPAESPLALAERLSELIERPALARRMGGAGRERVLARFTWQAVAARLLNVLASAAGKNDDDLAIGIANADSLRKSFWEANQTLGSAIESLWGPALEVGLMLQRALARGSKVLIAGNGGSATDAQHFAAELVGRFEVEGRPGLPALSLTADPAVLTAWANDYGFEDVFARQLAAHASAGDVFFAISTSGQSRNICRALETAKKLGLTTVLLSGSDGGSAACLADYTLLVPSARTARIQEVHTLLLHVFAEFADTAIQADLAPSLGEKSMTPELAEVI